MKRQALTGAMDQMANFQARRVDPEPNAGAGRAIRGSQASHTKDQSAGFEASMLQQNLQTQTSGANALMARLTERDAARSTH